MALGYFTCEASPNRPFSRREENVIVLNNVSKAEDDDRCLKLLKGYLKSIMRYDIMCKKGL